MSDTQQDEQRFVLLLCFILIQHVISDQLFELKFEFRCFSTLKNWSVASIMVLRITLAVIRGYFNRYLIDFVFSSRTCNHAYKRHLSKNVIYKCSKIHVFSSFYQKSVFLSHPTRLLALLEWKTEKLILSVK